MSDIPRRRLLALTGAVTTAAIAGCSSSDDDPDGDGSTADGDGSNGDGADTEESSDVEVEGTVLGDITVENLHEEAHSIDVLVEFDGEIEAWPTADLDADDGTTLDREWPSDPGSFRVVTRLDRGERREVTGANWNNPECLNLIVVVTRSGDLELWGDTSAGPCGSGEVEPEEPESDD